MSGNRAKANIDSKFMYAKIKDVSGKKIKCSSPGCIKSKDGTLLMEKKEILNRWSEYVEDLFKDDRCKKPKIEKNKEGPTILKEEVEAAIKKMQNEKATGPDNIQVEIIKAVDNLRIDPTTKLLNTINGSGTIPEEMCKSVFIVLPKTPGATECELHRTISLMSHFTKILLRVLMHRMRKSLRPEISPKHFGFMPNKGTRNAIKISMSVSLIILKLLTKSVICEKVGWDGRGKLPARFALAKLARHPCSQGISSVDPSSLGQSWRSADRRLDKHGKIGGISEDKLDGAKDRGKSQHWRQKLDSVTMTSHNKQEDWLNFLDLPRLLTLTELDMFDCVSSAISFILSHANLSLPYFNKSYHQRAILKQFLVDVFH
ncbi:LINE-1 retrotransposable element orf2 protein [Plakobranchus ocellatus]|uniref:LINE-1 retrotransposable element orf2 protein n=1 Tax=Plakobranchus ocellatus TaxID=259542 RepID=A0AAV4BWK0_9GAST|nr:LINE-1 retrotransposable element orf2 protein [Plakobranchus ocellatus]